MSLAIRRKVLYLLAAATIALVLVGATINAPAFADCTTAHTTTCTG
ncbi:MAG: hypothetical protein H6656_19280 [Ardenticatenaceae bacterium]|nr:hypothetical protein [Anaerolineales bacterium]MCB9009473.1 hypothetical protein [Ardenticatenaceae bacterium]